MEPLQIRIILIGLTLGALTALAACNGGSHGLAGQTQARVAFCDPARAN